MSIISVKNLTVLYENHTVINKLNFELNPGDFLCVVGSNGSGKSTLLKTILGLIKPNRGKVIFGDNLDSTQIGYIPQDNKITPDFPASVEEVVKSGILNRTHRHFGILSKTPKTVTDAMQKLKISHLAKKKIGELSGGQRQRALIARALVASNKVLILDEPANNLDHESRSELNQILNELNQQGLTIILVTHDLDHDNLTGNKILNLSTNFFGTTEEYVRRLHAK